MVPIEEFEASFQFMQECALFFLEVKDKDIGVDEWSSCLCSFLEKDRVTSHCLSATTNAWTIVFTRLNFALYCCRSNVSLFSLCF